MDRGLDYTFLVQAEVLEHPSTNRPGQTDEILEEGDMLVLAPKS